MELLYRQYAGNSLLEWLLAAGAAAGALAVALLLRRFILGRRIAGEDSPERAVSAIFFDLVHGIKPLFLLVGGLWCGAQLVALPPKAFQALRTLALVALLAQGAVGVRILIRQILGAYRRKKLDEDPGAATALGFVEFIANAAILVLVALMVLDNLGVNITALVAGLGIGGIAIAMAAQAVLSDLFASLSIVLDKPFRVGDFIVVGDAMGTVERIGLKSTLIRSPGGEGLVFGNGDLLKTRIRNFSRLKERRVEQAVGVALSTPAEKAERIPALLREAVEAEPRARFDGAHLKDIAGGLSFEVVYFVREPDYRVFLDAQESVNLAILRSFQAEEIDFAAPSKPVYVAQGVAPVKW